VRPTHGAAGVVATLEPGRSKIEPTVTAIAVEEAVHAIHQCHLDVCVPQLVRRRETAEAAADDRHASVVCVAFGGDSRARVE